MHYHGTPISPREQLRRMAGRNFCVSFAHPQDIHVCLEIGQSVMLDNGAFSAFTKGLPFDEVGYYRWLEDKLAHPHWAVVPDVIDGGIEQQRELAGRWPFSRALAAPVWHLGLPIDYLLELCDGWPRVCLGSSGQYWQVGAPSWCARMDEAFNALARTGRSTTWIHGLRMLGQLDGGWPLASVDSTNVAQNFKRDTGCAECKAWPIDAKQAPQKWKSRPEQASIF